MTEAEKRQAAKRFASEWAERGDEKQETQRFWLSLLRNVFEVEQPESIIEFEKRVVVVNNDGTSTTKYIDGYMPETRVLIEQKGAKIDLKKGERQSDGAILNPFNQGRRYGGFLPNAEQPRWIIACNFQTFEIHDMNRPNDEPEILMLSDLEKEYHRLQFLVDTGNENIKKEMEISMQAGQLVGVIYDALLKQYKTPEDEETLKSLNALCVRLVFCLYAEDAGIFGGRTAFHDYLKAHTADARRALIDLFKILDTPEDNRDPYLDDDLLAFPYVNGGLFADENIVIPRLTDEIVGLILAKASEDFDWSAISPTIFGAVFESTLNPETRRKGGMHYTSIENIHKVIDPLFLDELKAELSEILTVSVDRTRKNRLKAFQDKLAGLVFLDPACGSGNFLTETYISLRRLENTVISELNKGQIIMDMENPIKVSIGQFYGIEINDFAVTVAKTALWIAESQMMKETEDVVHMPLDFLPLKSYANIVEGNALRIDWESVVPKRKLDYIMGNPPFSAGRRMGKSQRDDMTFVAYDFDKNGDLDYVSAWYIVAARYMYGTDINAGFVSTSSIAQGEQVTLLWKVLFEKYKLNIFYAIRSFNWVSEAKNRAAVHCIIIEFSIGDPNRQRKIEENGIVKVVSHINGYLMDAENVWIEKRTRPICNVPTINNGSKPLDNAICTFTPHEKAAFIKAEPLSEPYFYRYMGSREFLNNIERYFLLINRIPPNILNKMPLAIDRLRQIREYRLSSSSEPTRKLADTPAKFHFENMPDKKYIVIPQTSSGRRKYIPIGFLNPDVLVNNKLQVMREGGLYEFGVLCSNVHNAWLRTVAGRFRDDFTYSVSVVYNTFVWCMPTEAQRTKIEETAQEILDARAQYSDCSLAELYNDITMPPELRKAHQDNDRAVMRAYGFSVKNMTESKCVAELMKMYQALSEK